MEERPTAQGPENTQAWPAIKPGMTDTTE
jgi:hypothetical protein